MNGGRHWRALPGEQPEWSEADLLQWLVDPERRATSSRAELVEHADPVDPAAGAERLAELESFVARCRTACAQVDAEAVGDEPALVERVLASTTREDLSWRGDLRLLRGYVANGLRHSVLLRVVAASLLVHALAMPVIAWYAWRKPEPEGLRLDFVPRPEQLDREEPEELPALEADPVPEVFELPETGVDALYVENSIRWGRYTALRPTIALPRAGEDEPESLALLRARLQVSQGGTDEVSALAGDASWTARALRAELLLDRFLHRGQPDAQLEVALAKLTDARALSGPEATLALGALSRAQSYGLLRGAARDALEQARLDGAEGALVEPSGELRRVGPFAPEWLAACASCGALDGWPPAVLEALLEAPLEAPPEAR